MWACEIAGELPDMIGTPYATPGGDNRVAEDSLPTEPVCIEVPQFDDEELWSFFATPASVPQQQKEEASIDTFNDIFIDSNDMYAGLFPRFFFPENLETWIHRGGNSKPATEKLGRKQ